MTIRENLKYNFIPEREKLEMGNSRLEINLNGGLIDNLVLEGVRILGKYTDINEKKRATHICCPFFDIEGMEEYKMPRHGVARDIKWNKNGSEIKNNFLRIEAIVEETEFYKSRLLISQIFELTNDKFVHTIMVKNGGREKVPVNLGVHNYWDTSKGWEKAMINGVDITQGIKENNVNDALGVERNNVILIPGKDPINWDLEGFSRCVFWSPYKETKKGISYDPQFMCAEPVIEVDGFFGSEKSMILPGDRIKVSQSISIKKAA